MQQAEGRMINKSISDSKGFAALSPEAAVLFAMLVPHYNAHGKMNGGVGHIKDEICPHVPYLTYENIGEFLQEITDKTSVKWFEHEGRKWLHSLKFLKKHQKLRADKLGPDKLPSYSGNGTGIVPPEVEEEEEVEEEGEGRFDAKKKPASRTPKLTDEEWLESLKSNPAYKGLDVEALYHKMLAWCDVRGKKPTRARLLNWLNREDKPMTGTAKNAGRGRHQNAALDRLEKLNREGKVSA